MSRLGMALRWQYRGGNDRSPDRYQEHVISVLSAYCNDQLGECMTIDP
jgi:hypothetical protein